MQGHADAVALLLDNGANVNQVVDGAQPLIFPC
jgi:ankyrin repeat protein